MQSLVSLNDIKLEDVNNILSIAAEYASLPSLPTVLKGEIVANLFFEPSTRTLSSFKIACFRLGGDVLDISPDTSAVKKGEDIIATVENIAAMGVRFFVVRHSTSGIVAKLAATFPSLHFINGGDGTNQHPTQALLDVFTIRQFKGEVAGLNISIVGDVLHSRVAGSLVPLLLMLGVNRIDLVGPESLIAVHYNSDRVRYSNDVVSGVKEADVIYSLRFQKERMTEQEIKAIPENSSLFCINNNVLDYARDNVIIMHPGPVNVGVELAVDVINSQKAKIIDQVRNGVFIRAAVFSYLLGNMGPQ